MTWDEASALPAGTAASVVPDLLRPQSPGTCETKVHTQECLGGIAAMQMKGLVGPNPLWVCGCPPSSTPETWQESWERRYGHKPIEARPPYGPPSPVVYEFLSGAKEQPAPVANELPAVWPLVMKDMIDRDQVGRKRYGVPLQPHNGRDVLQDAYEEALDLVVYLRQAIYERDNPK